ncbi:MAG: hypothetical protein KDE31_01195, partial [Caldilineaceae bacterium]|nr:hypothetical protein [Caldilineaceae bacterium]
MLPVVLAALLSVADPKSTGVFSPCRYTPFQNPTVARTVISEALSHCPLPTALLPSHHRQIAPAPHVDRTDLEEPGRFA